MKSIPLNDETQAIARAAIAQTHVWVAGERES